MHLAALTALFLFASQAPGASPKEPALAVLKKPPLSVDARALYDAAKALKRDGDRDVDVLLVEARFVYDLDGGRVRVSRMVYWLNTPAGVRDWGAVYASWLPGSDARPKLRARVIDGVSEHHLDPTTLTQAPEEDDDPDTFEDRQALRGPLPAARPGVVVEEVTISRDDKPAFRHGRLDRFFFQPSHEAQHFAVILEHPRALPVRYRLREVRATTSKKVNDDVVTMRFEGSPPSKSTWGPMLPPWAPQGSYAAFSTGKSWQSVASAYSDVVDRVLADSKGLSDIADAMAPEGASRDDVVQRVLEQNHKDIRYAALSFGHGGIVPRTPERTLERRYGDCKDKATLLVGVLRSRGYEAHVALLRAWQDDDVLPRMPGLGLFNHAIVYLPADKERGLLERWVDPTDASVPFGEVPAGDQGRLALVASERTTDLRLIPRAPPESNVLVRAIRVELAPAGYGKLVETTHAAGTLAHQLREQHVGEQSTTVEKALRDYAKPRYALLDDEANEKDKSTPEHPRPLLQDVRVRAEGLRDRGEIEVVVEVPRAGVTFSSPAVAEVWLNADPILSHVPTALKDKPDAADVEDTPKRRLPFQVTTSETLIVRHHVIPPKGYTMEAPPPAFTLEAGGVRLTRSHTLEDSGALLAETRLVLAPSQLTLDEVATLQEGFTRFAEAEEVLASFKADSVRLLEKGDARAALEAWRDRIASQPDEAAGYIGYLDALAELGFVDEARRVVHRGSRRVPKSTELWTRFGWTHVLGTHGGEFAEGWDRSSAEQGYRRALELSPDLHSLRPTLARVIALEHVGVFTSDPARLSRSLEVLEPIKEGEVSSEILADARLLRAALLNVSARHREILELAYEPYSDVEKAVRVGAEVLVNGVGAAESALSRFAEDPATRARLVELIVGDLIRAGAFHEAAALLRESARHTQNPAAAIQRAHAIEQASSVVLPEWDADVTSFAKRLLSAVVGTEEDIAEAQRRLLPSVLGQEREEYVASYRKARRTIATGGTSLQRFVIANLTLTTEGDDETGWLVRAHGPGMDLGKTAFLIVRDPRDRRYGVAEVRPFRASALATLALFHLEKGDVERARTVLSWYEVSMRSASPAQRKWLEQAPAPGLAALAVGLLGLSKEPKHLPRMRGIVDEILRAPKAPSDETSNEAEIDALHNFAMILARTGARKDRALIERVLSVAGARTEGGPARVQHLSVRATVYARMKRWDDALAAVEQALELSPELPHLHRFSAQLRVDAGRTKDAVAILRESLRREPADASTKNSLAWLALYDDSVPLDEALLLAREAVSATQFKNASYLHTLACLLVESGRELDALSLARQIEVLKGEEFRKYNALVWGRVAQRFGLEQEARRILATANDDEGSTEVQRLVSRWLREDMKRQPRE